MAYLHHYAKKNRDFLRGSIHRETEFSFSVVSASLLLLEAKKET